ncbi:hypothetical protein CEE45_05075 [Candidatus Heimdallarchaeota archaeon B3_Heim]|nr:MAG: hypothetical protein CEE45_05075 [Candidatus Heimdallarchaeota archaeon B3_Heim]
MVSNVNSLLELYRLAATGNPNVLTQQFWGNIPSTYVDLKKRVAIHQQSQNLGKFQDNIEELRRIAYNHNRSMGTLTLAVKDTLDNLDSGLLDVGHQPLIFGGSSFLMNKISSADWIGQLTGLSTFFFIGDHDSIQNELTVTRFPQPNSSSGLLITPPSWGVPDDTPMHYVPVPSEKWIMDSKEKIQENLRLLIKYAKVLPHNRTLLSERFQSWFDIIKDSAFSANDFSSWSQRIWSTLFILRNDLHIFLTPSSNIRYRKLIRPAFEFLLTEKNRDQYIETLNSVYNQIIGHNLTPGLPRREKSYVPFFLECLKCKTHTRVELKVFQLGVLEGRCPSCNEEYSFSYNSNSPDLSEIEINITPRSDSRAMVNNFTFPILVHVGGGGETQYYSAVIPAMKRLNIEPPILIRSNRIYYSTPWGEKSASEVGKPMLQEKVYNCFKAYNEGQTISDKHSALEAMRTHLQLVSLENNKLLVQHNDELRKNQGDKKLRRKIRNLELMLSHNYGRFTAGKNIQEVSWNWLDLALLTGIHNLSSMYQRQINEKSFPGFTWYINTGKYT